MSSLDSNDLMSMSLPVTKLVEHFKHSLRDLDFDEFEDILINRENSFKKEIENLKRDSCTKKPIVTLLDRNGASVDLEKLLFEELLGKEERKCQSLKEKVIQLTEEKEKLTDHVKTVDKKLDMLFMENLKMENAKKKLFSELEKSNRNCRELEVAVTQLTEEKTTLADDVKMANKKCDKISMEKMKLENERDNLISELVKSGNKCQALEGAVTLLILEKTMLTDHVEMVEEINLKMENENNNSISEMDKKIIELKNTNLESERLAEVYREKCRCLDNKIARMDQEIGQRKSESGKVVEELKLANKAIEDLRGKKIESDKTAELYKTKLENFSKMSTLKVGDMTTLISDVDDLATSELRLNLYSQGHRGRNENSSGNANVDVTPPSNGTKNNGFPNKGGENLVQHSLKKEKNEPKEPLVSGAHSTKSAHPSPAVIDIIDSDDESETNPNGVTTQTSKRKRTNSEEEGLLTSKRKRDVANTVPTRIGIDSSVQELIDWFFDGPKKE